eukprot:1041527-Prorocentrum_minimum.AAC.1
MLHRPHGPRLGRDAPDEVDHHRDEGITSWIDINLYSYCYLDYGPKLCDPIIHGGQRSQRAHLLQH